jgi:hypothetical protein
MATKYIAHLEIVRSYTRGRFIWEDKEFDNKWDAEKCCDEHRKRRLLGAYVIEKKDEARKEPQLSQHVQDHIEHAIEKQCDRFFSGRAGRLF